MLHIVYCTKDNSEVTIEASCYTCEYCLHLVDFQVDYFECTYLKERLQTGL